MPGATWVWPIQTFCDPAFLPEIASSRVMPDVVDPVHMSSASAVRDMLATYREAEDLINIGAYVHGSNPKVDLALSKIESIRHYLRQGIHEQSNFDDALQSLFALA